MKFGLLRSAVRTLTVARFFVSKSGRRLTMIGLLALTLLCGLAALTSLNSLAASSQTVEAPQQDVNRISGQRVNKGLVFESTYSLMTNPSWVNTGSMVINRLGHTATLLPNGKVLVVMGLGGVNNGLLNTAELYNPATGTWTQTSSLPQFQARLGHSATLLQNGKVLIAGGRFLGNTAQPYCLLYDPLTETWTNTGNLNTPRFSHSATLLPNGKVLVVGGRDDGPLPFGNAELYDPATGAWTYTGNMSNADLVAAFASPVATSNARYDHLATLLPNGKVLITGGNTVVYQSPYFFDYYVASADIYDPATGIWSKAGNLNSPRRNFALAPLADGRVIVTGGIGLLPPTTGEYKLSSTELFDPATGVWSLVGNLSTVRYGHTASLLLNSKVLVAGGVSTSNDPNVIPYLNTAELYDPATGTWSLTSSMNLARVTHRATLLQNGSVLVTGGVNAATSSQCELYDPGPSNSPPVAHNQSVTTNEDAPVAITLTASDTDGNPLLYSVLTPPTHGSLSGTAPNLLYTPAADYNGLDSFTFKVNDGTVDSNEATVSITVNAVNDAPTASVGGPYSVSEGGTVTVTASGNDPEGGTLSFAWDLDNDGSFETPGQSVSFSAAGLDGPGSQTIKVQVTDNGGLSAIAQATVTIVNVLPTATLNAPASVNEGSSIGLSLTNSADISTADTAAGFSYAFNCGSGYGPFGNSNSASCPAADNGSLIVKGKIRDKDGGESEYTASVTINNVAPTASFTASSPINEGNSSSLALGNAVDDSAADTQAGFRYSFACNGQDASLASSYASAGVASSLTCAFPDNGSFTVKGRVFDKDGGFTTYSAPVVVSNLAPSVGPITAPVNPVQVTTPINASASFTDAGALDSHTARWNWGDGSTAAGTITETSGSGSVSDAHVYSTPGVYTITLTVTDKDGAATASSFQYVVIYNPGAGFVTGGGWINSPTGAYMSSPALTGKANFGFVSKYEQGASVPSGDTRFRFNVANLDFQSTSYQWLVVAGPKAQFKGEGTINGSGSYSFMLTATDGEVNGGGGVDKFRIKIWDKATGAIVYDNQAGAADDANPSQALGGGSIVIHK